ncbi:hypothetical protein FB45DRAFT_887541 [Roridomyces roridus]|uniref:Uncharacterized protein n=1 Tax=Roridomyces roridus TaxID=1738132 RepID=A0AAD7CJ10_9AGAR|nr:hypothetical protein FB45DRAFT_887541 [Roridomyces roridus]
MTSFNNPFASSDAQSRYPDLNALHDPSAAQFTGWVQPGGAGFQNQQQQQFQPQQQPFNSSYQQGFTPQSPSQFQPTSSFGQELRGSYGYLQGQNMAQSPGGAYNPVQQQLSQSSYIAQFDPYASIGQGWDGGVPQQQQQAQGPTSPGGLFTPTSTSATGQSQHPREYLRTHKAEVESWDPYAWKQLLNAVDALKGAWETRKKEVEGNITQLQQQAAYGGYYALQLQPEIARLQAMAKDAGTNSDSAAASSFQIHEMFTNYRQSSDLPSKNRVREASNAAIASMPDWPPLAY